MTAPLATVAIAVTILLTMVMILVGVLRRGGLLRRCLSFVLYVCVFLVFETLITFWPSYYWNRTVWNLTQHTYEILKLAIAVELAVRALSAFPGTWKLAGRINAFILLATAAGWIFAGAPYRPLINTATIWLFAGTALVATYFHIPLHAWHRAILFGFTGYLTVFSTLMNIWQRHGFAPEVINRLGSLDQLAYLALVAFWAYSAWRPAEQFEGVAPEVLEKLNLAEDDSKPVPVAAT
jgi:hypothetical protein